MCLLSLLFAGKFGFYFSFDFEKNPKVWIFFDIAKAFTCFKQELTLYT